jgi:hypothetical protein
VADYKWCQNTSWSPEIEAGFEGRLARAKNKAHYLRIQAGALARSEPEIALRLLERYFGFGEQLDVALAHVDKAAAYRAIGDIQAAIAALEAALAREVIQPHIRTRAYLELPELVAIERLKHLYLRALDLLSSTESQLTFPVDRYLWNGARALILADCGKVPEARSNAIAALSAAADMNSGFANHPNVGLVKAIDDEFGNRLKKLVDSPAAGSASQGGRPWWRIWN